MSPERTIKRHECPTTYRVGDIVRYSGENRRAKIKSFALTDGTAGTSAGVQKFDFSNPVFTASSSALTSVRYA